MNPLRHSEPGRALDALVAICFYNHNIQEGAIGHWFLNGNVELPHYSTNEQAAWKLWEDIIKSSLWCCTVLRTDYDYVYEAELTPGYRLDPEDKNLHKPVIYMACEDFPLLICNMAIEAAWYIHQHQQLRCRKDHQ